MQSTVVDEDIDTEIFAALKKAAKGLTSRQLAAESESCPDLQKMVVAIHRLKGDGRLVADGMRESQVVYKVAPTLAPVVPLTIPSTPSVPEVYRGGRSIGSLRAGCFDMLEKLQRGEVTVQQARSYAALSMTIVKSLEVQIQYEALRKSQDIPDVIGDIELVPAK